MFNKRIMDQIAEAEAKRKKMAPWNALATILALGVFGPLIALWPVWVIIAITLFSFF